MAIRGLKVDNEGSLTPALMRYGATFIPAMDIDDVTGQVYSAGVPIGVIMQNAAQVKTDTLQPNDILNLKATPFQLLPPRGVGFGYTLNHIFMQYKFVTTPYGNTGANDIVVYWNAATSADPIATFSSNGFLNQTVSHITDVPASTVGAHQSQVENQAIMISHAGGASEFISGDGLLYVSIIYRTIQLV